jgi:hypothetical protein
MDAPRVRRSRDAAGSSRPGAPGALSKRIGVTAWTREDLIEPFQGLFSQRDFRGAQGRFQLFDCSGPDDGCGHDGAVQKPGPGVLRVQRLLDAFPITPDLLTNRSPRCC